MRDNPLRTFDLKVGARETYQDCEPHSLIWHMFKSNDFPIVVTPAGEILINDNPRQIPEGVIPMDNLSAPIIARQIKGVAFTGQKFQYADFVKALKSITTAERLQKHPELSDRLKDGTAFALLEQDLGILEEVGIFIDGLTGTINVAEEIKKAGSYVNGKAMFSPNFALNNFDVDSRRLEATFYAKSKNRAFMQSAETVLHERALLLKQVEEDSEKYTLSYQTPWVLWGGKFQTHCSVSGLGDFHIGEGDSKYQLGQPLQSFGEMLPYFTENLTKLKNALAQRDLEREKAEKRKAEANLELVKASLL